MRHLLGRGGAVEQCHGAFKEVTAVGDNAKLWAMHWHPAGMSHATFPHLHLYTVRPEGHFPTPRQTLESAVHWCIEMGAEPENAQWRAVLAESEGIHQLYRSWSQDPSLPTGGR